MSDPSKSLSQSRAPRELPQCNQNKSRRGGTRDVGLLFDSLTGLEPDCASTSRPNMSQTECETQHGDAMPEGRLHPPADPPVPVFQDLPDKIGNFSNLFRFIQRPQVVAGMFGLSRTT